MDRRERANTEEETIRMAFEGLAAGLWTAMPGIVQSFNAQAMTCIVQPAIQGKNRTAAGEIKTVNMPLLLDCPAMFPSGGGFSLTFPISEGDECLVVFANRCIDAWWQQGGIQPPMELRMHDLSDGFAFVGVFSQPRVLPNISANTTQLRSQDGLTYVEVAGGGIVNVRAPVKITLDTPIVEITGIVSIFNENHEPVPCNIEGDIRTTGDVLAGYGAANIRLLTHVHSGVQTGPSHTGGPV